MPTICTKIRLRGGSRDKAQAWAGEMKTRAPEVLESLREEGVELEACFLDQQSDGDYLIYVMHTSDIAVAADKARLSTRAIDLLHASFKNECWEIRTALPALIDFKADK
jgi:hypothetical protein